MVDHMTKPIFRREQMKIQSLQRSSIPLFLQMASAMRRRIEVGIWIPGSRIPSLEELASEFSVARTTARQAVSKLEEEGIIWRKQGKGTFVSDHLEDTRWLNLQTRWKDLIEFIQGTTTELLDSASNVSLPSLPPEEGIPAESYQYMKRKHRRENNVYCVIDIYLDAQVYNLKPKKFNTKTILSILDGMPEFSNCRAHQILTIGTADIENAILLNISLESPVANVRRVITTEDKKILYLGDVVYRSDLVKLDIYLK